MTITELAEILEDLIQADRGDAEILIAAQPSYPLAFEVDRIVDEADADAGLGILLDAAATAGFIAAPPTPVVWLVQGGHPHGRNPYDVPGEVFES
jgi:hypothetical protein